MKKDVYVGVLVGVIIGLLIAIILILLSKSKKESYDYGEVIKRENDYVYIKGNNTTTKITDESLNVGDIIKNENNTTTVITTTKESITTTKVSEEDIIKFVNKDEKNVTYKVKDTGDDIIIGLREKYKILTPGLNKILGNPYYIEVERTILK